MPVSTTTLNFGELSGPPYSGGGSDTESDQVKSLMELQQHQAAAAGLPGGYGLYRGAYNNPPGGVGGGPGGGGIGGPGDPNGFPGVNRGPLGGYPFPPMSSQNSYAGYPLGYPGSQSPSRDGKKASDPAANEQINMYIYSFVFFLQVMSERIQKLCQVL